MIQRIGDTSLTMANGDSVQFCAYNVNNKIVLMKLNDNVVSLENYHFSVTVTDQNNNETLKIENLNIQPIDEMIQFLQQIASLAVPQYENEQILFIAFEIPNVGVGKYQLVYSPKFDQVDLDININIDAGPEQIAIHQEVQKLIENFMQLAKVNQDQATQLLDQLKQNKSCVKQHDINQRSSFINNILKLYTTIQQSGSQLLNDVRKRLGRQPGTVDALMKGMGYQKLIKLELSSISVKDPNYGCYIQILLSFEISKAMRNFGNIQLMFNESPEKALPLAQQAVHVCPFQMPARKLLMNTLISLKKFDEFKMQLIEFKVSVAKFGCEKEFAEDIKLYERQGKQ